MLINGVLFRPRRQDTNATTFVSVSGEVLQGLMVILRTLLRRYGSDGHGRSGLHVIVRLDASLLNTSDECQSMTKSKTARILTSLTLLI